MVPWICVLDNWDSKEMEVTQELTLVSISLQASHMLALFHGLTVVCECGKE